MIGGSYESAVRADIAVACILAESDVDESLRVRLLAAIAESLGWDFGAWWELSSGDESLTCVETWRSEALHDDDFEALSKRTTFARGEGLPGRVWATGKPAWIVEVEEDRNFPRADTAARAGLRSAFAFPVQSARSALGAIEMFACHVREPDEEMLQTMTSLGSQLGQLIDRRRAEHAIRESNERRRAILEAALDAVITIDEHGDVVEFNPAAERTFGYRRADAIGRDMSELIIPLSLRARHRSAFHRLVTGAEPRMIDRRLELTGMRADGGEFPVELTITRIGLPGPPMFTGYLRDITDRKRAEAELRESRLRIVQAADDARRRLERDLHDGAQARLVNLALALRLARGKLGDQSEAGPLLDQAIEELTAATRELREFARGIHPAVLSEGGLAPAIRGLASRARLPIELGALPAERLAPRLEATAYFVVAESLTNAARHSEATRCWVDVRVTEDRITVEVRDDGRGGAEPTAGSGLKGLADRVSALDGSFAVVSPARRGTTIRAEIPCG